ncbi:tyrosine-type recombinase/integrase [Paralcaligenes ureilyticus]|uniref:Integrase n=1 Tax=Paralcaligenes ureilyticus TaxID=627131 RepID=A0A4R3M7Y6_9BURK|nr:tyrosine-type recombinase/integrase [Paralcaligenes ureilyticus]TCT09470.1 integrase [Paralcaligenes ureilyticus]
MALTDIQVKQAKPREKPYALRDGTGLYLEVKAAGKYWRWDYRYQGKRKTVAYGVYPAVSLTQARARHQTAQGLLEGGADPMALKKAKKHADQQSQETSFKVIAQEWYQSQVSGWSADHAQRVMGFFDNHIYPEIGSKPIAAIPPLEVLDVIRKMEAKGLGESCYKALAQIGKVFMYAVVSGRAQTNAAAGLRDFLKPAPPVAHHRHMDEKELGKFMRLIDTYGGLPQTRIATKLVMLCFMRSNELRQATWAEIDWEAGLWRIPSAHRKGSKTLKASGIPHIIPLSRQAVELLRELEQHTGERELMFEGQKRHTPISENTINKALAAIGYGDEQSTHGFRSLASTILNEHGFNPDAIERQLSHIDKNQVRRAYDHSKRLDERATMLQWWADYLYSKAGSNVVPLAPAKTA